MARYSDKDEWIEEILIPDTTTPILGGQPVWEGDRLISGFSNVSSAILADRTRHLKNKVDAALLALDADSSYETLTPGDTVTVQVGTASLFRLDLDRDLTSIVFSGTAAQDGKYQQFTMILKQGTGSNLVEWPENVRWSFGNEPALSFSQDYEDVITFVRHAQSTVWYGFFNGGSFHV